ncbi:MAG: conjugal transfer protein TrbE [Sphingomonadales bacterium]|nr:conjugal transfer protein TrbE [Sphingomonadales bacterium]
MLNLAEYRKRPDRLADYLPWAALVAPGVVLNKDGSLQRTIRFRGPDMASAVPSELIALTARINNALMRFCSGWTLFVEARREAVAAYPDGIFPDPVSWLTDRERKALFADGGHYESRYYLTLVFLPPVEAVSRTGQWLYESARDTTSPRDNVVARFLGDTDKLVALLEEIFPDIAPLDDAETLSCLHDCISTKRHPVAVPEVPMHLDALLVDTALSGGVSPKLGDSHLRILSVLGFPASTLPGLLNDLNDLGLPYRWTTRFIVLDRVEAQKELTRYRRQWFAKRKSLAAILKEVLFQEGTALTDSDAENKAADADLALQALGGGHVAFGYVSVTIVVGDRDPEIADTHLKQVERVVNGRGFVTIRESLNAVEAWLGSLPGHLYANIRQPLIHSLNLAHLIPVSAIWAGPEQDDHLEAAPLFHATTGGTTPFRFALHVGDVGHTLILGPTGAGKSVLLAMMMMQFRRYEGAQIFAFDKGRSLRATSLGLGGRYLELGTDTMSAFQPLRTIDTGPDKSRAADWVHLLLAQERVEITPDVKAAVWSALDNLQSAPEDERTISGLALLIQSNRLKQALEPYTLVGAYGRLLDGDDEDLDLAVITTFEMETLMATPAICLPVLTYLFHKLEARFDGRPTLLLMDEAWLYLDHASFAGRIRDWLKTLRKKNVAVVFATQSLSDIAASAIAPSLLESCPNRIYLPNARARDPELEDVYRRFGLNDRQIRILSEATPKRDYYLDCPLGRRLFALELGDIAKAFAAAGSAADHTLMDRILAAGADNFAAAFLKAKGLAWAADLLNQYPEQPS